MSTIQQENVIGRVRKIIAEQLGQPAEDIRDNGSLVNDYGADSLDQLEIVMYVEDEFGLEIPDEAAWKMDTPQAFINYVNANA